MTTTTELPLNTDTDRALALYHAAMHPGAQAALGDTSDKLENDGAPTTVIDADKKPAEEVKAAPAVEHQDASNSVLMAKDGKHTIDFGVLTDTRAKAQQWQAKAEAAEQELATLKAAAQSRADIGVAPTSTDNMVAAVEAAIDAGVDISVFGDFSEQALAAGIDKHVDAKLSAKFDVKVDAAVKAAVDAALAPIHAEKQAAASNSHVTAILEAHPDAGSVCQSVELDSWIKSQPSYLQPAMRKVQEEGSTAEVIELIGSFKTATGVTQATAPSHKQAAQDAIAKATSTAPIPASLSDIPGGRVGGVSLSDRMASMSEVDLFNAVNSGEISEDQLNVYLNRKS